MKRKGLLLSFALVVLLFITGCKSQHTLIDWADTIKINDISYIASDSTTDEKLLGSEFSQINFKISDNINDPDYKTKNGDAAFLDAGTTVYRFSDYSPEFRLAVKKNNKITIYEVLNNPGAKTAKDLLDIQGKVASISINSEEDNTEITKINNSAIVQHMVDMLLKSPIQTTHKLTGSRYFIAFNLRDNTKVTRAYWPKENIIWNGIALPQEFAEEVEQALDNKEKGSPSDISDNAQKPGPLPANKTSPSPSNRSPQKTSDNPPPPVMGITVNKISFEPLTDIPLESDTLKERGFYVIQEADGYIVVINAGEKRTTGYAIKATNVEDNEGKTIIYVKETGPAKDEMAAFALTYPTTAIKIGNNISPVFEVRTSDNESLKQLGDTPKSP